MNILVVGGSYFLGKCFVQMAAEKHQITVFNRGNRPLPLSGITEVKGDRHNPRDIQALRGKSFDVVVDFCAYEKGDIRILFENLHANFKQYIFISTCDVYERGQGKLLSEDAPLEERDFGGEAGAYITGKVALEKELIECGQKWQVAYTSIRPAFIYGEDNYAPREGIYFYWIQQAGQILHPVDADGEFQMVYVEDVAKAVLAMAGNSEAYGQAYNLAPLPMETYETFAAALAESYPQPFEKVSVTLEMVQEKEIPFPFPLTKAESNWYDGRKGLTLIGNYTSLSVGLKSTIMQNIIRL